MMCAISPIREAPRFHKFFCSSKGICPLPGALWQRIEDFATIADRCTDEWLAIAKDKPQSEFLYGERLYLVFVEKLFSFVIFTLNAWACLGGYNMLIDTLAKDIGVPPPVVSYQTERKGRRIELTPFSTQLNVTPGHMLVIPRPPLQASGIPVSCAAAPDCRPRGTSP